MVISHISVSVGYCMLAFPNCRKWSVLSFQDYNKCCILLRKYSPEAAIIPEGIKCIEFFEKVNGKKTVCCMPLRKGAGFTALIQYARESLVPLQLESAYPFQLLSSLWKSAVQQFFEEVQPPGKDEQHSWKSVALLWQTRVPDTKRCASKNQGTKRCFHAGSIARKSTF